MADVKRTLITNGECIRTTLIIFNTILAILGIAMTVAGFVIAVHFDTLIPTVAKEVNVNTATVKWVSLGMAIIGISLFFLAIYGFFGIIKEHRCCLVVYIVLLCGIIMCQLILAIITIIYRERIRYIKVTKLRNRLRSDYSNDTTFTDAMNFIQFKYSCCGIYTPKDYRNSQWYQTQATTNQNMVPRTCCTPRTREYDAWKNPLPLDEKLCFQGDPMYRFQQGCYRSIKDNIMRDFRALLGIGITALLFEIITLILVILYLLSLKYECQLRAANECPPIGQPDIK